MLPDALSGPPHRYLESCSEAATLKRKCEFLGNMATQKASDKRKAVASPGLHSTGVLLVCTVPCVVTQVLCCGIRCH